MCYQMSSFTPYTVVGNFICVVKLVFRSLLEVLFACVCLINYLATVVCTGMYYGAK